MKRVAVITGGSGGIGRELCRLFRDGGYAVFELSRSGRPEDKIEHIDCDVSDQDSVKKAFETIAQKTPHISVLVNNAGMGISGAVEFAGLDQAKAMFGVNLFGTVCAVQHALPLLRAAKGRIVNVSSAAAVLSVPFQALYSASKSAINSLSLALANEVNRFGVTVCVAMPADTRTGFTRARLKNSKGDDLYNGAIERSVSQMERAEDKGMEPEYVAKRIYGIATRRYAKALTTIGPPYRILAVIRKLVPENFVNWVIRLIYAR